MYPHKKVGILQIMMSALSFLAVRPRRVAVRRAKVLGWPDSASRAAVVGAQLRKESYFEMARHSRWNR